MNLTVCPLRGPGSIPNSEEELQAVSPWLITPLQRRRAPPSRHKPIERHTRNMKQYCFFCPQAPPPPDDQNGYGSKRNLSLSK